MIEKSLHADVKAKVEAIQAQWFYSDNVRKHFFHPRNLMKPGEEKKFSADGIGVVGSPACGDMMKMWIKVDKKTERIKACKWQTFGCASAIASTSMLSVMVTKGKGMTLEEARKITPQDIVENLHGLPARKYHCSVLGDKALRDAINDYFRRTKQFERIKIEGAKVIDKMLKITDKDIEEAVLQGAKTFEEVQAKTKIGTQDKSCIPEVKELIKFYLEKHNLAKT